MAIFTGTQEDAIPDVEDWITVGYHPDRRIFWFSSSAWTVESTTMRILAPNHIIHGIPLHSPLVFALRLHRSPAPTAPVNLVMIGNTIPAELITVLVEAFRECSFRSLHCPPRDTERPIITLIDALDECDTVTLPESPMFSLCPTAPRLAYQEASQDVPLANTRAPRSARPSQTSTQNSKKYLRKFSGVIRVGGGSSVSDPSNASETRLAQSGHPTAAMFEDANNVNINGGHFQNIVHTYRHPSFSQITTILGSHAIAFAAGSHFSPSVVALNLTAISPTSLPCTPPPLIVDAALYYSPLYQDLAVAAGPIGTVWFLYQIFRLVRRLY